MPQETPVPVKRKISREGFGVVGAVKPTPEVPKAPQRYVSENALDDAVQLANELFFGAVDTVKLAGHYIANPGEYVKDAKSFIYDPGMAKEVGGVIGDAFLETHKNDKGEIDLWESFTKRPFHFLSDASALISIAGGATSLTGRIMGGLGKAERTIAKVNQMTKASKLVDIGEATMKVARNMDPVLLAGKGTKFAIKKSADLARLAEWTGNGELTKPWLAIKANEFASEEAALAKAKMSLAAKHLSPEDGKAIYRAVRRGADADIAALTPAAREWYGRLNKIVVGPGGQEEFLKSRQLGLTDQRMMMSNAIAASLEEFGDQTRPHVRLALKKIKSGEWKPTYATLFRPEKKGGLIDTLTSEYQRNQRYGRLEGRTGVGEYEKDIFKVAERQLDQFHHTKARIRLMDRTIQMAQEKGVAKAISSLKDLKTAELKGYAVIDTALLKKYFEVKNRAGALFVDELLKGIPAKQSMRDAYVKIIGDPSLREPIKAANLVAVPTYLARLIDLEFARPGGIGLVYDKLMNTWRALATVWRPVSWLGAAAGDAFLSLLHGVGLDDIAMYFKVKGTLPPEILSRVQLNVAPEGATIFERASRTAGEAYSAIDNGIIRGPVFAHEAEAVRRKIAAALKQASSEFFIAADVVNDKQKWLQLVAASPEVLSRAQRDLQVLEERIAGQIPEVSEMLSKIEKYQDSLSKVKTKPETWTLQAAISDLEGQIRTKVADTVAAMEAAGKIKQTIPELAQIAQWADDAIETTNRLGGNYIRLHPIERRWFRRAVPFWPYTKTMLKFVVSLPFLYPKRVFLWNRWSKIVSDLMREEETPDWLRGYIPVGHSFDGDTYFTRLTAFTPWGGVRTADVGTIAIPSIFDFVSQHPLIKVGYELSGGIPKFTKKPVSVGDGMVRMDNGEVYKFMEGGRIKKTLAQPSIWRSLWYLFPQAQLAESLLIPYTMTDRGWAGFPEAIRDPRGEIVYPRDLLERVTSFIGPTVIKRDLEEDARRTRRREQRIIKEYIQEMRYKPPAQREAMKETLRDWLGQYRERQ